MKLQKMNKTIYMAASCALMLGLTACQADMDTPDLEVPVATLQANTTILELKTKCAGDTATIGYLPDIKLYEINQETGMPERNEGTEHVIIKGRVVSSDASGNIYKSIVIQDETAALAFSVNQSSTYIDYRLGQEVMVDMTGLMIGYYRGLQQVGALGDPYNGEPQLGFMAYDYWLAHSQKNGLPNPEFAQPSFGGSYPSDEYYCISFSDFDQLNSATLPELQSQLVEFRNVYFQEGGKDIFAPHEESVNRTLVDANGKTLTVRNSGYSNFYNAVIPEGHGVVRGILSYYGDAWQLVLRDISDVMVSDLGESAEKPFTVTDILSNQYYDFSGWSTGYIVGSVRAGVSNALSDSDVVFGKDAEMDNNLLIAATPDVRNVEECVVVELPQNTVMRYYGNLVDNPGVFGKQIWVNATIGRALGRPALVGCNGSKNDFMIDGVEIGTNTGETPRPSGSGTESDPYNIGYVMASTTDQADVWVTGYIAGYVATGNFEADNVEFSASAVTGSSNYLNNTNIVLSEKAPMACSVANSIPVQLSGTFKTQYGLKANPSAFGKKVTIKCTIKEYLGVRGIRNITEIKEQ